jgi:hypothetical protein
MPQRIVYLSWPASEITGGIKLAFRHVEILCEAGFDAVIATPDGKPPQWFETTAPVTTVSTVLRENDFLVFPENHHGLLKAFAEWSNRKVVFCQNHFMAVRGLGNRPNYTDFGISAILTVSRQGIEFCRRRFPALPTILLSGFVDHRLFHFQPQKRLQIAFAPRKRPLEAAFIRDLFRAQYPDFATIPWVEIAGVAEQKVAQILRDSAVYLALCRLEALPLSILEAFACGCVVSGFTGIGAREYTTASNGYWAEEDDCLDCVRQLAKAARLVTGGGPMHSEMLEAASVSAKYYSRDRMAERLIDFWRSFLGAKRQIQDGGQHPTNQPVAHGPPP